MVVGRFASSPIGGGHMAEAPVASLHQNAAMPLYLIGMPAVGKSTLAHVLAPLLHRTPADVDDAAEALMGCSIADAIATHGPAHFREAEAAALQQLSRQPGLVVATGGNTPCSHNGMALMLATGVCVWLQAPPAVLAARIWANPATRTHLTRQSLAALEAQVAALLHLRTPTYARAQLHVPHPVAVAQLVEQVQAQPTFL